MGCNKDEFQQTESPELKCAKITLKTDRDRDEDRKRDKDKEDIDKEQNKHYKIMPMKADFCFNPDMAATPMLIAGLDPNNPGSYLAG